MQVLSKEDERILERLGIVGFVRFVKLMGWGKGDWTEERRKILKELNERLANMTPEEVVKFFREGEGLKPGQIVV
jgi:hypothetical protein